MRGSRLVVLLLVLAVAVVLPTAALAADLVPGTARAAVSKRGAAAVVPADSAFVIDYLPFPSKHRVFAVFMRLPAGSRARGVLVKHKAASKGCRASYAADPGTRLVVRPTALEAGGYLTAVSGDTRFLLTGARRFCIWPTRDPRARVKPAESVVRFIARATAVVSLPFTAESGGTGVQTWATATRTFKYTVESAGCPGDGEPRTGTSHRPPTADRAAFTSFTYPLPECDFEHALTVESTLRPPVRVALSELEAGRGVVRAGGDACVLPDIAMPLQLARRVIKEQGCRVGRVARSRSSRSIAEPGEVWQFMVHGAKAELVPRRTVVDMLRAPG